MTTNFLFSNDYNSRAHEKIKFSIISHPKAIKNLIELTQALIVLKLINMLIDSKISTFNYLIYVNLFIIVHINGKI
jgi:hypothetical protein